LGNRKKLRRVPVGKVAHCLEVKHPANTRERQKKIGGERGGKRGKRVMSWSPGVKQKKADALGGGEGWDKRGKYGKFNKCRGKESPQG